MQNLPMFSEIRQKKRLVQIICLRVLHNFRPFNLFLLGDMSLDFFLGLDDISSYVIRGQTESLRWSVNSLFRRKVEIGNFVTEKKRTALFLSATKL